jgi:hypothetical protein
MEPSGQFAVVLVVVAVAAVVLIRRVVRVLAGSSGTGCGSGCGSCGSRLSSEPAMKAFVPLEGIGKPDHSGK